MKLVIRHDPDRHRFFASIGGEEATLLYAEAGARTQAKVSVPIR